MFVSDSFTVEKEIAAIAFDRLNSIFCHAIFDVIVFMNLLDMSDQGPIVVTDVVIFNYFRAKWTN